MVEELGEIAYNYRHNYEDFWCEEAIAICGMSSGGDDRVSPHPRRDPSQPEDIPLPLGLVLPNDIDPECYEDLHGYTTADTSPQSTSLQMAKAARSRSETRGGCGRFSSLPPASGVRLAGSTDLTMKGASRPSQHSPHEGRASPSLNLHPPNPHPPLPEPLRSVAPAQSRSFPVSGKSLLDQHLAKRPAVARNDAQFSTEAILIAPSRSE